MKKVQENVDAVILSGGTSRRFQGKNKSLVRLHGKTLLDHQLKALQPLFSRIILITKNKDSFADYEELEKTGDILQNKGPLGGIHAGMSQSNKDFIFVFAGDMPFLNPRIIKNQLNCLSKQGYEAVIPETPEGIEPLHSIYSCSLIRMLELFLNKHETYAVHQFLKSVNVFYWSVPYSSSFININSEEELAAYENRSHFPSQRRQ